MANTYVNKVQLADGTSLIDISDTTATADKILTGYTAYGADGSKLTGTASAGGSVTQDQDGFIVLPSTGGGGGGGSGWTLLASEEFEINTTSTSFIDVGTISAGASAYTSDKIVFVKIRDKAGARNGYYLGSDCVFFNPNPANNYTSSWVGMGIGNYRYSNSLFSNSNNSYGVVAYSIDSSGDIAIRARYSSSVSSTINGTFKCDVYLIEWPDNISPFVRPTT